MEMAQKDIGKTLYIFLDESGDLTFSPQGSKYFLLTGMSCFRPFHWHADLVDYKFKMLEVAPEMDLERFHATSDLQTVRDGVYEILKFHQKTFRVDSIVVQKNKAHLAVQSIERFYPMMLKILVKYIIEGHKQHEISQVIIITDSLPVKKERKAVIKGIKEALPFAFSKRTPYKILHWSSRSTLGLQAVDYCSWAIYKKWTDDELRPFGMIEGSVHSQFDVFRNGRFTYYEK